MKIPEVTVRLAATGEHPEAERMWHRWFVEVQRLFDSGYTGDVTVVTGVDFTSETVTTATLTFENGVLTDVS